MNYSDMPLEELKRKVWIDLRQAKKNTSDAMTFKQIRKKMYTRAGKTQEEALRLAYLDTAEHFLGAAVGPAEAVEEEVAEEPVPEPSPQGELPFSLESADLPADILWAYGNLYRQVAQRDAPNAGAWGILEWARGNKPRFYEMLLPKALAVKEKRAEGERPKEDLGLDEVRKLLKQFGGGHAGPEKLDAD